MDQTDILAMQIRNTCLKGQEQRATISHLEKVIPIEQSRIKILLCLLILAILWWSLLDELVLILNFILMLLFFVIPLAVIVIYQVVKIRQNRQKLEDTRMSLAVTEVQLQKLLEQLPEEAWYKVQDVLEVTKLAQSTGCPGNDKEQ